MKIEIEIPKGYKAEWVNGVLTLVQDKKEDLRPVTERVKTFEDACNELGDNNLVHTFKYFEREGFTTGSEDLIAYLKLRIITAALNEGWKPQFVEDEYAYCVWYDFYTKEGWSCVSEEFKRKRGILLNADNCDNCSTDTSFACVYSDYTETSLCAAVSSHLYYKTEELALYSGKQFANLWMDFCYLPNTECKPYINE